MFLLTRTPTLLIGGWLKKNVLGAYLRYASADLELACTSNMSEDGKISVSFYMNTKDIFSESPKVTFLLG